MFRIIIFSSGLRQIIFFYLLEATISFSLSTLAPVRSAILALFLKKMKVGIAVICEKKKINIYPGSGRNLQ